LFSCLEGEVSFKKKKTEYKKIYDFIGKSLRYIKHHCHTWCET